MKKILKFPFITVGSFLFIYFCIAIVTFFSFFSSDIFYYRTDIEFTLTNILSFYVDFGNTILFFYNVLCVCLVLILIYDLSNAKFFLYIITMCKKNNLFLFLMNVCFLFFSAFGMSLFFYDYTVKYVLQLFFAYFDTFACYFTIYIFLLRFFNLFKNTTFAKKLRRIKRRALGRIWPWLFKVYCKNKAIRRNFGEYL